MCPARWQRKELTAGAQVAGSLTEIMVPVLVTALRSATHPAGAGSAVQPVPMDGKVETSTMRKRSLVMGCPRLLVNRRRKVSVPKLLVNRLPGVVLRTRFGAASSETVESNREMTSPGLNTPAIGLDRFSGPGAPSRLARTYVGADGVGVKKIVQVVSGVLREAKGRTGSGVD